MSLGPDTLEQLLNTVRRFVGERLRPSSRKREKKVCDFN